MSLNGAKCSSSWMKSTRVDGKRSLCRSGILADLVDQVARRVLDHVDLLALQQEHARVVVRDDLHLHVLDLRLRARTSSGSPPGRARWSFFRLVTMNGPLPTGLLKNASPCACTCFVGTIAYAYIARSASSGACGRVSLMTSVVRARRLHALHRVEQEAPAALQVLRAQDREGRVLRRERRAVGELRVPQVEGVRLPPFVIFHDVARSGSSAVPVAFGCTSRL